MTGENESHDPSAPVGDDSARAVFVAWERLRIVYNAALAVVVLAFGWSALSERAFYWHLFWAAVGANLCLCLGSVAEGYLVLFGSDRRTVRWVVFVLGLLLAGLLAYNSVSTWRMSVWD